MAEQKKKRRNYSLSIKQTDSPVIEKFLDAQTNYSESVRYLILKFCSENGVQDISYMLNSMMFPDLPYEPIKKVKSITVEEAEKKEIKDNTKDENSDKDNNINNTKVKEENIDDSDEDDIPDCYE